MDFGVGKELDGFFCTMRSRATSSKVQFLHFRGNFFMIVVLRLIVVTCVFYDAKIKKFVQTTLFIFGKRTFI